VRAIHYYRCFAGILAREALRFVEQRGRFLAALVRPLIWLLIFGMGLRDALGQTPVAPYGGVVHYAVYLLPGLAAMIQLFAATQNSLSMVYDREMGSMRVLLTSPLPRWYLLASRLGAGALISIIQVYAFFLIAALFGFVVPAAGYALALPALLFSGVMLGAFGLFLSSTIRQLENFAGVMNFVVFPMFFLSSALYPLAKLKAASVVLYYAALANPFTHAVEAIRYALYGRVDPLSVGATVAALVVFVALAVYGYDPARALMRRKAGEGL
jgi:ABC-2 type transport system permease protein